MQKRKTAHHLMEELKRHEIPECTMEAVEWDFALNGVINMASFIREHLAEGEYVEVDSLENGQEDSLRFRKYIGKLRNELLDIGTNRKFGYFEYPPINQISETRKLYIFRRIPQCQG